MMFSLSELNELCTFLHSFRVRVKVLESVPKYLVLQNDFSLFLRPKKFGKVILKKGLYITNVETCRLKSNQKFAIRLQCYLRNDETIDF